MIADDLFAGAGGWDLAAAALGIHARGIENMPEARATRDAAGLTTIHDDVWTFTPDGKATGGIASPPCPTFSQAGKGSGRASLDSVYAAVKDGAYNSLDQLKHYPVSDDDDRTRLVLTPLHFATGYEYEWLAWEQVPQVLPVWEVCAEVLRAQGWYVWTGYVQAEQFGVAQTRKRAKLLASRHHDVFAPVPTHSRYYPRTRDKLDTGVKKWVSMAEGIGWGMLNRPSYTVMAGGGDRNTNGQEWGSSAVRQVLFDAQDDPEAWREKGWGMTDRPYPTIACSRTTGGPDKEKVGGSAARKTIYDERDAGRWITTPAIEGETVEDVEWAYSRPSPTIVGSFHPEVVAAPGYRKAGDPPRQKTLGSIRINIEEAAVLQSFPANYPWQGNQTKKFMQVGNAVPPGMAIHSLATASGLTVPNGDQ